VHLAAVVQDLTALKQLSEMERSLQNAQRIASLGNWDWQVETGELWWSDEIYRIFGREPRSFGATYQAFLAAVHPDDRAAVQRAVDLALRQEAPYDIEHRIVRPGGEVRTVREQGEVVLEGGRPVRMIGLVHDVTERIEMEARLHQAQKLETLGRLTGGIAHDFNNLLTVVMGNLDIARAELGDDHPVVELLDEAGRAVELGSGLTDRLLTFSRRQHLQPQVVDADGVLQGLHGLLQRTLGERVRVAVEAAPGAWPCLADPGQLQNAVLNLAINARDAMPDGGRLCLAVTNRSLDATQAQQLPDASPGDYVRFSVSDTGAGMEPYVRERAFDPFFTTKERGRGTGLGLSMVYGFVVQSGGFVEIDTAPGEGTTFHLHLPRATAAAADEPPWDAVVRGDARNPQRNAKPR
jgi:PAS domain S-box-containing protein